ncbi:MAG: FKBP-type peptidyl-prolyl cis-trans isomerase [Bacteroidales bacterium]|nr:FKBP-type peptidyl-prolyl cis-trans isomerase [Bacteroidales bacterium]
MKTNKIAWLLIGAALLTGCAKSVSVSDNADNKAYIEAWMAKNHPGISASGTGIYILDDKAGTGTTYSGQDYVYIRFTIRDMNGNISSTTEAKTAQQIGSYDKTYFYGPEVIYAGNESLSVGMEDLLTGMKTGGTRTALVPNWLMGYKRYDDAETYYEKASASDYSNTVYSITLVDTFDDETAWETDSLSRYLAKQFPTITKLEDGIYYQKVSGTSTHTIPADSTVYINYTGRLLNGQVFDTNDEKTAKIAGIYSSSNTYKPTQVNWGEAYSDLTMGSSGTSMIEGFAKALFQMHPGEKGIAAFISDKGYGASGSGMIIPSYSPLLFEFELVPEP